MTCKYRKGILRRGWYPGCRRSIDGRIVREAPEDGERCPWCGDKVRRDG